jgi:hypothetical protein
MSYTKEAAADANVMGCDIHAFLEVFSAPGAPFDSVFAGEANLPRDDAIFRALAGVRRAAGNRLPLFPPRGLPRDLSEAAFEHFYRFVIHEADIPLYRGCNYVTLTEAPPGERLPKEAKPSGMTSVHGYVPDPDCHTPSFLFLTEIHDALRHAGLDAQRLAPEWRVAFETLGSAERLIGKRARLVFWFDN